MILICFRMRVTSYGFSHHEARLASLINKALCLLQIRFQNGEETYAVWWIRYKYYFNFISYNAGITRSVVIHLAVANFSRRICFRKFICEWNMKALTKLICRRRGPCKLRIIISMLKIFSLGLSFWLYTPCIHESVSYIYINELRVPHAKNGA